MVVPVISCVTGLIAINKIRNGTALKIFIIVPSTRFKTGLGLIPFLPVTTSAIPRGNPKTYEKKVETSVIYTVFKL